MKKIIVKSTAELEEALKHHHPVTLNELLGFFSDLQQDDPENQDLKTSFPHVLLCATSTNPTQVTITERIPSFTDVFQTYYCNYNNIQWVERKYDITGLVFWYHQ